MRDEIVLMISGYLSACITTIVWYALLCQLEYFLTQFDWLSLQHVHNSKTIIVEANAAKVLCNLCKCRSASQHNPKDNKSLVWGYSFSNHTVRETRLTADFQQAGNWENADSG